MMAEHAPVDIGARHEGARAVGDELDGALHGDGGADRQDQQQDAEQDQPAGHAENARQHGGQKHRHEQSGGDGDGHVWIPNVGCVVRAVGEWSQDGLGKGWLADSIVTLAPEGSSCASRR